MATARLPSPAPSVSGLVRSRIEAAGERVWKFADFGDLAAPPAAVAQSLSRLSRSGMITRVGRGIYFRPRGTMFGPSRPMTSAIRSAVAPDTPLFPAGLSAANLLGFSTQIPARREYATTATAIPVAIVGRDAIVHTRRPATWRQLTETEAALLDFLRRRGDSGELEDEETVSQLLRLLKEPKRFERLVAIAAQEPPRVRAMLGAAGQQLNKSPALLRKLKRSLHPLSRFDFGRLTGLTHAAEWQIEEPRRAHR